MPKFYTKRFEKEVAEAARSRQVQEKAYAVAKQKADFAHKRMIKNFDTHPVTREIAAGPSSGNWSGTLGGYGNLFSFIGFPIGANPTRPIRDYLKSKSRVQRLPKIIRTHKELIMKFKVDMPKIPEIELLSPSPWEGRSWTRGIERGISGLGSYMFSKSGDFKESRSGKAVQSSKKIRTMAYRPIKYITSILNSYKKEIQ